MTEPVDIYRQLARRQFVMRRVEAQRARYRVDFPEWLEKNFPIWERFEAEADAIYESGRRHWSARTIGEYLRHETALRERESVFKISDWWWPHLARLYIALKPERSGFFELRGADFRERVA